MLGGTTKDSIMNHGSIISDAEALQILKNDLRRIALEKHVAELNNATPERTSEIMARIEEDIEKEIRQRARKIYPGTLLH
jgi:diaminopimelate decarboxylase